MAEIIRQMDEDVIRYQGVQAKKPLGPDLNVPAEEGEASDCNAGERTTAAGEIASHPVPLDDTCVTKLIIPAPCSYAIDAINQPASLALDLSHVPAEDDSTAVKLVGDHTAGNPLFASIETIDGSSHTPKHRDLLVGFPDSQGRNFSTTICSVALDVDNFRDSPQEKEFDGQVFSENLIKNSSVIFQHSVNRKNKSVIPTILAALCDLSDSQKLSSSQFVQNERKIDFSHRGLLTRPQNTGVKSFQNFSTFHGGMGSGINSTASFLTNSSLGLIGSYPNCLQPSRPNLSSLGPYQNRQTSAHGLSLDRSEHVEFDLVKMFSQDKEQVHDPTPLSAVFPLGPRPKDDLLVVPYKRQRTKPSSGPVEKPTWKPVGGKHVASGQSSGMMGTKGKETEQLEEGEINEEVHSFNGFSSELAFKQYRTFCNKIGHTPKGFNEHTLHDFPQIQSTIRGLKWDILCTVPKPYNLTWVREFFAEVSCVCSLEVTIQNTKVDFSAKAINKVLNLIPPGFSKLDQLKKQATQTDLDHILEIVARPGAEWSFRGTSRVLLTQFLKPIANVWYYFVRNTLHPSNHDPDLCLIRVFLIYCIMTQQPLDVGKHISRQIKLSVTRATTKLPYPAIIHMLMVASRVPIRQSDQFSRDKMIMDRQNIDRLIRNKEVVNPDYPPNDIHSLGRFVYKNHVDFTAMMKEQVRGSGKAVKMLEEIRGDMRRMKEKIEKLCKKVEKMEKEKAGDSTPTPKGVGQV